MRTSFAKTFSYYIIVVLITNILLSLGFTEIFKSYYYSYQRDNLLNQAIKISDICINSGDDNLSGNESFQNSIELLDRYMDFSFLIVGRDLSVEYSSKDLSIEKGRKLSHFSEFEDVLTGEEVWLKTDIDDIYNEKRYLLCYPVLQGDSVTSVVFVSASLDELNRNMNKVYLVIIFFLMFSVVLGFITINWTSKEFVNPLRKLSAIAKHIAKGNFDEKIEFDEYINDEINELCTSFNIMAGNLQQLEKRRREIISDISHDLRSPITSIRGFLGAMLDGTIPEEKYRKYLEIIFKETGRLNQLSNTILDLNKLDDSENALDLSNFDINAVINENIRLMRGKADIKGIQLIMKSDIKQLMVNADIEKIRRVLNNLTDNAIKFTKKGSVTITSSIEDDKAVITVEDTGIGISDEEQTRVFERLYKTDLSRGMDKSGSGLGLAIVKEFIRAHNQEIELTSCVGKGSCFRFTLNLA